MPQSPSEESLHSRAAIAFVEAGATLAMVVGNSPVNRVVVARITERTGLRVLCETPETAYAALLAQRPATVILDGGADDRDCDILMETLASQRLESGGRSPFVILLSNRIPPPGNHATSGTIDAVVAKPIMPERLQPLIRDRMERLRHA